MFFYLFTELCLDRFNRPAGHNFQTSYSPSALGVFSAHKMASAGMPAFQPAGRGDFDPFGQTLVAFLFRHLTDSFKIT